MFAGNFAPAGWALCQGQLMPISENETLFNLIGTTYGGDGSETFALPDLQGRIPVHMGSNAGTTFVIGENGGVESVTITSGSTPIHNHGLISYNAVANTPNAGNNLLAQASQVSMFFGDPPNQNMANSVGPQGGSQPHDNMMPYLCLNFIISLFGVFPTQS